MSINSSPLNLDPMEMIFHCDTLFVSFHLDLCIICRLLEGIDAHEYSVNRFLYFSNSTSSKKCEICLFLQN